MLKIKDLKAGVSFWCGKMQYQVVRRKRVSQSRVVIYSRVLRSSPQWDLHASVFVYGPDHEHYRSLEEGTPTLAYKNKSESLRVISHRDYEWQKGLPEIFKIPADNVAAMRQGLAKARMISDNSTLQHPYA